jgi:hypothetical protein
VNPAAKTMYNYAPELDGHIKTSLKNMAQAEDDMDYKWDISQPDDINAIQMRSDPIYGSSGPEMNEKKKAAEAAIVPYPDPSSMTLDHEIVSSQKSMKDSQEAIKSAKKADSFFKELMSI